MIWKLAFYLHYPLWRLFVWLWVRHDFRLAELPLRALHCSYAWLYAKSGVTV